MDSHARSSKYFMTALERFSTRGGRIPKYHLFPITLHTCTHPPTDTMAVTIKIWARKSLIPKFLLLARLSCSCVSRTKTVSGMKHDLAQSLMTIKLRCRMWLDCAILTNWRATGQCFLKSLACRDLNLRSFSLATASGLTNT